MPRSQGQSRARKDRCVRVKEGGVVRDGQKDAKESEIKGNLDKIDGGVDCRSNQDLDGVSLIERAVHREIWCRWWPCDANAIARK